MPDMMCKNQNCPSCVSCLRFTAKPSENQRYYEYTIRGRYSISCDQYWPAREPTRAEMRPYEHEAGRPFRLGKYDKKFKPNRLTTGGTAQAVRRKREQNLAG